MKTLSVLVLMTAGPSALAQAAIAGSVRDPSGGTLSGMSIEASSPALIEKARTTFRPRSARRLLSRPGQWRNTIAGLADSA